MAVWSALLLALAGMVGVLVAPTSDGLAADDCPAALPAAMVQRLRGGVTAHSVWGLSRDESVWVLYPVTKDVGLPANYVPADLVRTTAGGSGPQGALPVRRLITPDLEAMFAAAQRDGVSLGILSGYRSYEAQENLFLASVGQQVARGVDREAAEANANRFRARPGHSQHQLGTTVDLTSPEMDYRLGQRFAETRAGQWVRARAWEFGFVLPYTPISEPRTGYASEPWHVRWLGRALAAVLMADGYLDREDVVADDYLVALDALVASRTAGCVE
jgi:D-alanyl-D-alanine carboxypeptidase